MPEFEFAFVIEKTFNLTQCGLVVVSGPCCSWEPLMKQSVLLKFPDGSELTTNAKAMLTTPNPFNLVSLNLYELSIDQVPEGTEVWIEK